VKRVRSTLLLCAVLTLGTAAGSVQAQQTMDLPPSEDHEAWTKAWLEVAKDDGGPEAIPRLAVSAEHDGWALCVWDSQGTPRTVGIQQPHSHADRVDLIFLAISLAARRDDWGWSAIEGAVAPPEQAPLPEEPPEAPPPSDAESTRPTRSFVSASSSPASVSAPLPEPSTPELAAEPPPPAIVSAGPGPLAPTPSTSAPAAGSPEPEPLDPLFPEPRDPIPILDDPTQSLWPSWAWVQLGAGPTWRPETSPAWEGTLRGGWTGRAVRLGLGARATTPTQLQAFHAQAERTAWDLNLLAGPWVPIGPWLEAGLEGGVVVRRYHQQGQLIVIDTLPTAALELVGRIPVGGLHIGPYLRGTVDLDSTPLYNGPEDPRDVNLQLWSLSLGFQLAGIAQRTLTRDHR
jgi:hypothetical protein